MATSVRCSTGAPASHAPVRRGVQQPGGGLARRPPPSSAAQAPQVGRHLCEGLREAKRRRLFPVKKTG
eukprot:9140324-Pyramimonas_sp.AAC.1